MLFTKYCIELQGEKNQEYGLELGDRRHVENSSPKITVKNGNEMANINRKHELLLWLIFRFMAVTRLTDPILQTIILFHNVLFSAASWLRVYLKTRKQFSVDLAVAIVGCRVFYERIGEHVKMNQQKAVKTVNHEPVKRNQQQNLCAFCFWFDRFICMVRSLLD